MMMDIRNLAVGLRERYGYASSNNLSTCDEETKTEQGDVAQNEPGDDVEQVTVEAESASESPNERPRFITPLDLSTGQVMISMADMVDVTNALKANIDVELITPNIQRIASLPSRSPSPAKRQTVTSNVTSEVEHGMGNFVHTVADLQREVLLLRNELNFELWIQRENVKHIGRLYQDRILMKSAEAERQGLVRALSIRWYAISESILQCSTTNCASIVHKLLPLRMNCAIANGRHPLRRASMLTGTWSYNRDSKNFVRRKKPGYLKQLPSEALRKKLRYCTPSNIYTTLLTPCSGFICCSGQASS